MKRQLVDWQLVDRLLCLRFQRVLAPVVLAVFLAAGITAEICAVNAAAVGAKASYPGVSAKEFNVTILGTIISQKGTNVVLLKNRQTNKVEAQREGSQLNAKYTIVEITPTWMLLSYQQGGSQLFLQVFKDGFGGGKKVENSGQPAVVDEMQDSYREDGFERDRNSITMTDAYREKLIKTDLPVILMQASAEPVIVNGQIAGFRLDQIEANSIFSKAGIKNGDIITSINERPLDDVTATIKLLNSLKNTNEISFEMQRNNQKIPVILKVQ